MYKQNRILIGSATALLLIFSSCKKDSISTHPDVIAEQAMVQRLVKMGFNAKNIEDKGTYYLVEEDIRFDKSLLTVSPEPVAQSGVIVKSQDQASTNALVNVDKQFNITIKIDATFPSQWVGDAQQAVGDWNSILKTRIKLVLTSNATADIVIKGEALDLNTYGVSGFPNNGNPYPQVSININNSPDYRRRTTIVHEIGHCLGLRHTDLYVNGEGASNVGGNVISGTPREDPNSVMNSGSSPNRQQPWQGFSQYDVIALQTLYPDVYDQSTSGYFRIVSRKSGSVLDVKEVSNNEGALIQQWNYANTANQQ